MRERSVLDCWLVTGRDTLWPVVECLEAMNWCLREKGLGLLAFPGLDKLYEAGGVFTVYRGVSHVNLRSKAMPLHVKICAGLRFFRIG